MVYIPYWYIIKNIMSKDAQFHLRIDKNIHSQLNKIAKKEGRNLSDVIREAIAEFINTRSYINLNKSSYKKIEENENNTVEKIIESLADGYYKRNTTKPKNKKSNRRKKKTIEEIFENLIYD